MKSFFVALKSFTVGNRTFKVCLTLKTSPMTASRSDCSREPADEIPAVAEDEAGGGVIGEDAAASSPKLMEVLFTRPNMSTDS